MSPLTICQWLETTPWSIALHESLWVYPIVESVHVLTLCLFLGTAILLDLRLLGAAARGVPVSQFISQLMPWTVAGFVIMLASGGLLFYAIPVRTYLNIFFRIKMALLVVAGLNVYVFHNTIYRQMAHWDDSPTPPRRARIAGGLSLILWAGIVAAGRMIAYNWFDPPGTH